MQACLGQAAHRLWQWLYWACQLVQEMKLYRLDAIRTGWPLPKAPIGMILDWEQVRLKTSTALAPGGVCSKRIVALHLIHSCPRHLRVDTTASSDRIWLLSTVIADCNGSSGSFDGCLESLFLETSPWPRTPPGFVPLLCLGSRAV